MKIPPAAHTGARVRRMLRRTHWSSCAYNVMPLEQRTCAPTVTPLMVDAYATHMRTRTRRLRVDHVRQHGRRVRVACASVIVFWDALLL